MLEHPVGAYPRNASRNLTAIPPTVTHLLAPAPYGGLESVVEVLAAAQAEAGHDVTVVGVFTHEPTESPFWNAILRTSVRAIPLVLGGREYLAERKAVRRILEETGSDVLHTHGYRPDVMDAGVARRMGISTVTTVHGFTTGGWKNQLYERMQRRAFRRFDAVVAVSAKLRDELIASGVGARRIHTLPNAWEPRAEFLSRAEAREALGLDVAAPVVGWVGRLSPGKGPDVMLEALLRLRGGERGADADGGAAAAGRDAGARARDVRISFIGDGPAREGLEQRVREAGAASHVVFHGRVAGAGRYLRAFDAFVMTSWSEGTPMVILEAMAAGVPIVTTAVGGIPDVVSPEEALLVPAGDVEAIAAAVHAVLADPQQARRRAETARMRLARDFAVAPWVERYRQIYDSCLVS